MEEKKIRKIDGVKAILKLAASASVMASATAMSVIAAPVTMVCAPLGVLILTGNVVATSALSETIVDPWIDSKVDGAVNYVNDVKKKAQEIVENTEKESQEQNKEDSAE